MINEKAKIIENNINEILSEGEDFVKIHEELNALLSEVSNNETGLINAKRDLLNYLLKHSKRKILFEFVFQDGSRELKYKIGLNNKGLGYSCWGGSLRNIVDYYGADRFEKLFKDEEFIKEFLKHTNKHLKGKHKAIIKKCLIVEENFKIDSEEFIIGKVEISLKGYQRKQIYYSIPNNTNLQILTREIKRGMEEYSFSFIDLKNFMELIEHKKEIIIYLGGKLKKYKGINDKIKIKLAEMKKELSPFEALENI